MVLGSRSRMRHRKLRLFAVACCRLISHLVPDARSKHAIEVAERYADGYADDEELLLAMGEARTAHRIAFAKLGKHGASLDWAAVYVADRSAFHGARNVSWMSATPRSFAGITDAEYPIQVKLVHEIFGNPFRPVAVDPVWLTWRDGTIPHLAQTTYHERRFADMPVLADALEDAGCTNADILQHCRMPGEHARGLVAGARHFPCIYCTNAAAAV